MLMGDRQELSGFVRSRERDAQDKFWRALKEHVDKNSRNTLQLDENERLCAMALIKRLLPHVAKDALGWTPSWDGKPLRWPSTPRLAATGWLRRAWQSARQEAEAFVEVAEAREGRADGAASRSRQSASRESPGLCCIEVASRASGADELGCGADQAEASAKNCWRRMRAHKKAGEPSPFYRFC